ncbi:MAG: sensor histidine kinase, partial [Acidimicrobiales bacterium]
AHAAPANAPGAAPGNVNGVEPAPAEPASPPGEPAPAEPASPPAEAVSSPGAGRATVPAHAPRQTVRISVVDRGVGIPARDLDRIFERFYRVDHGRSRDTGGTGLGLSIVRHVANNHQGWVEVESREGEGSTFTLVLPLQPEGVPAS